MLCFQETHGRIEHLANVDIVLGRATWMKFGTFTPENVNSGGSVILARKDILGPGTTVDQKEIFPARDYLVRIRQIDCSCTVINLHYQPEGTLQELRRRLRAAAKGCRIPWLQLEHSQTQTPGEGPGSPVFLRLGEKDKSLLSLQHRMRPLNVISKTTSSFAVLFSSGSLVARTRTLSKTNCDDSCPDVEDLPRNQMQEGQ